MSFKIPDNFKETEPANLNLSSKDEVYLLRVPKGFDVSKLNGKEFIPNQITEIEVKEEQNQLISVYELSSFAQQPQDILPIIKNREKAVTLGPQISGILNVSKSYRLPPSTVQLNFLSTQDKRVSMPEGLRPRFVPFGSGKPHKMRKSRKKKRNRSSAASESFADHSISHGKKKRKIQNTPDEPHDRSQSNGDLKRKKVQNNEAVLIDKSETLNNSQEVTNSFIHRKKKKKMKIKLEEND